MHGVCTLTCRLAPLKDALRQSALVKLERRRSWQGKVKGERGGRGGGGGREATWQGVGAVKADVGYN